MLSKWKNLKRWQKWVVVILGLAVLGKFFEITVDSPNVSYENVAQTQMDFDENQGEG